MDGGIAARVSSGAAVLIPAAPASMERRCVVTREDSLHDNRPGQASRSHSKSFQVTTEVASAAATSINAIGPLPGMITFAACGCRRRAGKMRASRAEKKLWEKRNHAENISAHELRGAVSHVALAHPAVPVAIVTAKAENPAATSAFQSSFGSLAPADQIQLIQTGPEVAAFTSSSLCPEIVERM